MAEIEFKKLLKDKRAVEEIRRHQWLESEKVGYDIGFNSASEDWLKRFSKAWLDYHMPEQLTTPSKSTSIKSSSKASQKKKSKRSSKSVSKTNQRDAILRKLGLFL